MGRRPGPTELGVVFIGEAPGVGKTSVARPLAARLDMDLTHVDDFQIVLERMTDPDRYPSIHEWRLHAERVLALDDAGMLEHTRSVAATVADAIAPVIAARLDSATRSAFEGDFIQPAFAASAEFDGVPGDGRVRSSSSTRSRGSRTTSRLAKARSSRTGPRSRGPTANGSAPSAPRTACRRSRRVRGRRRSSARSPRSPFAS